MALGPPRSAASAEQATYIRERFDALKSLVDDVVVDQVNMQQVASNNSGELQKELSQSFLSVVDLKDQGYPCALEQRKDLWPMPAAGELDLSGSLCYSHDSFASVSGSPDTSMVQDAREVLAPDLTNSALSSERDWEKWERGSHHSDVRDARAKAEAARPVNNQTRRMQHVADLLQEEASVEGCEKSFDTAARSSSRSQPVVEHGGEWHPAEAIAESESRWISGHKIATESCQEDSATGCNDGPNAWPSFLYTCQGVCVGNAVVRTRREGGQLSTAGVSEVIRHRMSL